MYFNNIANTQLI